MNSVMCRWSGIRIDPKSPTWAVEFETCAQGAINQGAPIIEMAKREPFLFEDQAKNMPTDQLIRALLVNGEVFFVFVDDKLAAYWAYRNVRIGQHAECEIYLAPEYRKSRLLYEIRETVVPYAWEPFPGGIGLIKAKACINPVNKSAIIAAKHAGLKPVALLPVHSLFNGVHCNMLYLERYHPSVEKQMTPTVMEKPKSVERTISTGDQPERTTSLSLHQSGELHPVQPQSGGTVPLQRVDSTNARKLPKRVYTS